MATILDVGFLSQFSTAFAFLFVLILVYGILSFTHFLGGSKGLQAFLAFLIAIFVLLTPKIGQVFLLIVPWLTLLFILILFIFLGFKMFGVTDSDFRTLAGDRSVVWTLLSIIVITLLWGVVQVYGTPSTPNAGEEPSTGFTHTLGMVFFHPKVLGGVFILLMAMFAIYTLTGDAPVKSGHGGHGGH